MKLTQDGEVLAENKVLILYILNKLQNPITNDGLLRLVLSVMDMNYFYFQQFLLDLLEKGYIISSTNDGHTLYDITNFGKETLELTQDILPGIIKLRVDANFKDELDTFENKHSIIAEYTLNSDNSYNITCKIIDSNDTVFEVRTFAGSRDQAKEIVDNWNENADKMYPAILDILTNKN